MSNSTLCTNGCMICQLAIMTQVVRQYFSELEKSTLTELVDKYKNILENKFKNNQTENIVCEEFNSQYGVNKRESKQLRKCWDNIKARAKK